MKMKSTLLIALVGVFFLSCTEEDKWPEKSEIEFNEKCASSYVESFESTMGDMMSDVNRTKLDKLSKKQCACTYETLKKNFDSAEEAFAVEYDELLSKTGGCEPTDAEIDDLLVK
jgi:hypothetical protein